MTNFERRDQTDCTFYLLKGRKVYQSDEQQSVDGSIAVLDKGIIIRGNWGNNPSASEMREMVAIMRECVQRYDSLNEVKV